MESSAAITFKNVSKSFGSIKALKRVSFEIAKGEFVFIIGASGAGKTTILKLILAEYQPSEGDIFVGGVKISDLKKKEVPFYRQSIGTVFQDFKLLPERTVRENVEVALAVKGVSDNEWEGRVNQVLKLVGMADRAELFPSQLSGGEVQRAAIARSLVTNPQIIIADEPTGNLDWDTAESIMDLLMKINAEGKTIIVTSHHKTLVHKLKKRVLEIKDGEMVKDYKSK
jgi:cell division transport system ATP-binding protein